MTISAYYDEDRYAGDIASLGGWSEFREWAPPEKSELAAFCDQGWSSDLDALAEQLRAAMELQPPSDSVRDVSEELLRIIAERPEDVDSLYIGDGIGDS